MELAARGRDHPPCGRPGQLYTNDESSPPHTHAMPGYLSTSPTMPHPRLDHLFGVFRTAAGRLRRMDVIVSAPAQLPFATIAWIGGQGALAAGLCSAVVGLAGALCTQRVGGQGDCCGRRPG